jgi:hypothetical protein
LVGGSNPPAATTGKTRPAILEIADRWPGTTAYSRRWGPVLLAALLLSVFTVAASAQPALVQPNTGSTQSGLPTKCILVWGASTGTQPPTTDTLNLPRCRQVQQLPNFDAYVKLPNDELNLGNEAVSESPRDRCKAAHLEGGAIAGNAIICDIPETMRQPQG